jgi:hypothetical protein
MAESDQLLANLRALAESQFPKRCANCGRVYATADEFIAATAPPANGHSGLKQGTSDEGRIIVELFRNCVCGSTLMNDFSNRRDETAAGIRRRERFDTLANGLRERGVADAEIRAELLKLMHGQPSRLLSLIRRTSAEPPQ